MHNPLLLNLFWELRKLKGVGPTRANAYQRLNLFNVRDLIFHYPYQIIDRRHRPSLEQAQSGTIITQVVTVIEHKLSYVRNRNMPQKIICSNDTGKLTLIYFNAKVDYLKSTFPINRSIAISGKVEHNDFGLQMVHPDVAVDATKLESIMVLEPVYPSTFGLNSRFLSLTVKNALNYIPNLPEWIPQKILSEHNWPSWFEAINHIHNPNSEEEVIGDSVYKQRLAFDELLAQQISLQNMRLQHALEGSKDPLAFEASVSDKLTKLLPFTLTEGQEKAIKEIVQDQTSPKRMNRLILGDVGCGKTIVALFAICNCIEAGKQTALMVPTEILAKQHYSKIKVLCDQLGIKCVFLTGKLTAPIKRQVTHDIEIGEADLVIGTHALFQEKVIFKNLGLVIIDEQHRFGVEQRRSLLRKGMNVDFLMMSATPIPRTLCMVNYGDLDITRIADKPLNRTPILTSVVPMTKITEVIARIQDAIEIGEKVYWVCPLIEESEALDLSNLQMRYQELKQYLSCEIGVIHGKMPIPQRDEVMQKFINGEIKILLATTVIEVGVDVSDATIMIIENAERFGLSQLHQLRGRVGRGSQKSHCILVYGKMSQVTRERLKVMKENDDGFTIAEADLRLRGSGEIWGTRQSGLPSFRSCDIRYHLNIIPQAHDLSQQIVSNIDQYPNIQLLMELFSAENYKIN